MSETRPPLARSYASGTHSVALLGGPTGENFDRPVSRFGDREALVDVTAGRRWTYRELAAAVDALARGLLGREIGTGDRFGIWAPNCAEWTLTQYATAKIGAILVNINPAYGSRELEYVLRQAGVRLLVAGRVHRSSDYAAMIDEVRPACPDLDEVVLLGSLEWDELARAERGADPAALAAAGAGRGTGRAIK